MDQIDPTSLALLGVLAVTGTFIALHLLVLGVRRRFDARRWQMSDEVIDLTFVHEAIRRDQAVARRIAAEAAERTTGASR